MFVKLLEIASISSDEIKSNIIGIFIGLAKGMKDSFDIINKSFVQFARKSNKSPFVFLTDCLLNGDNDIKLNVLYMVNYMLSKSSSMKKRAKFLARLETIGIYDVLRAL